MRPSFRRGVKKGKSARQFRKNAGRTNAKNVRGPDRGGYRL